MKPSLLNMIAAATLTVGLVANVNADVALPWTVDDTITPLADSYPSGFTGSSEKFAPEAQSAIYRPPMSQSLLYHAFGVREGYEYVRTDYQAGAVQFHLAVQ